MLSRAGEDDVLVMCDGDMGGIEEGLFTSEIAKLPDGDERCVGDVRFAGGIR